MTASIDIQIPMSLLVRLLASVSCSKDRKSDAVYQVHVFFTEAGWPKKCCQTKSCLSAEEANKFC